MRGGLTGTADLLRQVQSGQAGGVAVALDLWEVPHAENPLFRRAVMELVDRFAGRFTPEIVDTGPYSQVFLFHGTSPDPFIEKLHAVASDFAGQHLTAPRFTVFHLPADTARFVAHLRRLLPAADDPRPSALTPAEAQRLAAIHRLGAYEQVLSRADIAAVVRESPVWRHDADGVWSLLFSEVTVALDSLERAIGVPLRHDPWLLQQISPILDRRIIRHFQTEPTRLQSPHSINLLAGTVVEPVFQEFMRGLSFDQRVNLIIELPITDPDLTRERLEEAVDVLRLWDCRIAFDHLSLRNTDPGFLPLAAADYLKVDMRGLDQATGAWEPRIPDWMLQFGLERLIALCPDSSCETALSRTLGFRLVERRTRPPPDDPPAGRPRGRSDGPVTP